MKSLKSKMLILILPIFVIILMVTIIYSFYNAKKIIVEAEYENLSTFVKGEKDSIQWWFDEKLNILEAGKVTVEKSNVTDKEIIEIFHQIIKNSNGDFSDIFIGTTEGNMLDGGKFELPPDFDPRKRPWYSERDKTR